MKNRSQCARYLLMFFCSFLVTPAMAQYDKFRNDDGPVYAHDYAYFGSAGYAYQGGHFLQIGFIYGANYLYKNNDLKSKFDNTPKDMRWDYAVTGFGLGFDASLVRSEIAFAPKIFAEFETHKKMLFYRVTLMDYFFRSGSDWRLVPEIGSYFGRSLHMSVMAGYSFSLGKGIDELGRFRMGLNVYPRIFKVDTRRIKWAEAKQTISFDKAEGIKEPQMVWVEGGSFKMGYNEKTGDNRVLMDEKPLHDVTVANFFIGKNEVTVGEFRAFIKSTGYVTDKEIVNKRNKALLYRSGILKGLKSVCYWNGIKWQNKYLSWSKDALGNERSADQDNHPVIYLTVNDALRYCEWLSKQTGKKYRLPTEAEWEYAAKGGNKSEGFIYSGGDSIENTAWYDGNSTKKTHPVGIKEANELGIYDMTGNVCEMCSDWYDGHYYEKSINRNPQGPEQSQTIIRYYVIRGGSWGADVDNCIIARRNYCEKNTASNCLGFRLVREE